MKKPFSGWLRHYWLLISLAGQLSVQSVAAQSVTAQQPALPDSLPPAATSPYTLKTSREGILLGSGLALYGTAYVLDKNLNPLTIDAVDRLDRGSVLAFDRSATGRYSATADQLSDLTLGAGIGLTGVVIVAARSQPRAPLFGRELYTVGVMYVETMLLTNGLKSTVKNAVQRTRPFAYNPAAPLAEKLERDAQRSFYSGHAANAFATALFASEVFRHYHPASRAKGWVWAGSLGLATGTAVLRYQAGQHFPSDLIVGAAVGSLAGWGIPRLHQVRSRTARRQAIQITPWTNSLASGIYLRWNVSRD